MINLQGGKSLFKELLEIMHLKSKKGVKMAPK